jgi:hypothetical protein
LRQNIAAARLKLTPAVLAELDAIAADTPVKKPDR